MPEPEPKTRRTLSRRRFLQALAAVGLATTVETTTHGQVQPPLPMAPEYLPPAQVRGPHAVPGAYTFLMRTEARFIEAACERIIPSDELGPGAVEAGVPLFIDQQLQGKFGLAAKWYMQGPWQEGAEEQGYQLPLTPQEVYRVCIPALDMYAEETYGAVFADLSGADQDDLIRALEAGELEIEPLPSTVLSTFWELFYDNVMQGFFADPAYGGNRDKVGWRLVGFPGVAAAYRGVIEAYYGVPYLVEPVSIADIQGGLAEADATGHAVHRDAITGQVIAGISHDHGHGSHDQGHGHGDHDGD